ncbi:MAG: MraY family glycosyltransferase [Patescibacteria group bacterium]|nr:MraY family glycosyltransferase [Patescibacteria group bacterium]MDD5121654.1 MraY family glycosyltransferase [Patescibacteria group bacterium]MDD5222128.1 MraY family glycosyltransferase [Patescibacteria group bacterium]MDD5396182.1 MraY family glycosyltransferase [Patescibacteria group bacterium]
MLNYFVIFLVSFLTGIIFTWLIRLLAIKFKIIDWPKADSRHIHREATPLLGGLAVFLTFFLVLFSVYFSSAWPVKKIALFQPLTANIHLVTLKQLIAIFLASCLIVIGGWLDDKYHFKPRKQIVWPILATLIVIIGGVGINYLNNPFGEGYLYLNHWQIEIFKINGVPFYFTPLADIFTFIWLMLVMYSTKLLDGLDGLTAGMGLIGSAVIFCLSMLTIFYQPEIAVMALVLSGACLGFLFFNFYPARIFLGEGGSLLVGFLLGTLAVISGGKIAVTFLVLGVPILDLLWVVARRVFQEKKSPFSGDRKHLHFRLLDLGFSHRGAVIFIWLISLIFGLASLFLRTKGKIFVLVFFVIFMSLLALVIILKERRLKLKNYEK